jgi:hypothetical protein
LNGGAKIDSAAFNTIIIRYLSSSSPMNRFSEKLWHDTVKRCPDLNMSIVNSSIGQDNLLMPKTEILDSRVRENLVN